MNNNEKGRQVLIVACFFVGLACLASIFAYFLFPPGDTRLGYFCISGLLIALAFYSLIRK